jgi:adenylate cyclase
MISSATRHRAQYALLTAVGSAALVGALYFAGALTPLENAAYDQRFRWLARPELASPEIVVINFDNASFAYPGMLENLGRWPWRRNLYALLLHYLRQAPPRAVGVDIIFAGSDAHAGDDQNFAQILGERPDTVLAFSLNRSTREGDEEEPPELILHAWQVENAACGFRDRQTGADLPLALLAQRARALGSATMLPDRDGVLRRAPLLFGYRNHYYPAFALAVAAPFLDGTPGVAATTENEVPGSPARAGPPRAEFGCDGILRVGARTIPVEQGFGVTGGLTGIYWYGPESPVRSVDPAKADHSRQADEVFRHYPVWQIYDSAVALVNQQAPAVAPSVFKDKIVLIGPSAAGTGDNRATPFSPTTAGVEIQATLLSNLLGGHFVRPAGDLWALLAILLLAAGTSILVWRFDDWRVYTMLALGLVAAFVAGNFLVFDRWRVSLVEVAPLAAAGLAYTAGNLTRYLTEGREKRRYRATLVKYVAPQLVEAIMANPRLAELHNEKLDLTVLFSDVRGFTSLSEKIPVGELVTTLNEFLNAMVEVIFENGGTLDKFVGDCVMAIWGAPVHQQNHAELACRTALEMQAALERLNQRWKEQGRPELKIGVGINTGEMIFGNIGSERRMDFTVIGDNVNLASRLESSTKELKASIVISESTHQRVGSIAQVRDLGSIHVKGKDVPIHVYELLGMSEEKQ